MTHPNHHTARDEPSSMPHFVLMPGFDGTGELFAPLIDALVPAHSFTIVRYSDECSLAECVSTAVSFLPEPRVVLIAESFSAPVAFTSSVKAGRVRGGHSRIFRASTSSPLIALSALRYVSAMMFMSTFFTLI